MLITLFTRKKNPHSFERGTWCFKLDTTKYAIACDRGSSPSRKLLGTHLYGKFILARGVSIMFQSPQMYEQIKNECKAGMAFIVNSRFIGVSITPKSEGDLVLHVTLPSNASDDEVRSYVENPEQTVKAGMGSDLPITVIASSCYNMHALISTKFRVERVLLLETVLISGFHQVVWV